MRSTLQRNRRPAIIGSVYLSPLVICSAIATGRSPLVRRTEIEAALRRLAPRIRPHELAAVVDHALDSRGLRSASAESAAWLSLIAYARHTFTEYDDLLEQGYDRDSARFFVAEDMQAVLTAWGVARRLTLKE